MFSGIVEATTTLEGFEPVPGGAQLFLKKPNSFNDLSSGDSIAVNGICLTLEEFSDALMQFSLGQESLRITGWSEAELRGVDLNLERSLRLGDRVHGHLVTGHVDDVGHLKALRSEGQSLFLDIEIPEGLKAYLWPKGSVAVNGVSLTLNQVDNRIFSVCVIPETQRRTNLGQLRVGQSVNLEVDNMARAWVWNQRETNAR